MKKARQKRWWFVKTDCGSTRTWAVSAGKAAQNARYQLVMGDRRDDRPTPRDLAEMNRIKILEVAAPGAATGTRTTKQERLI